MTKHLSPAELDLLLAWQREGLPLATLRQRLRRHRKGGSVPTAQNISKALRGKRYKRAVVETRGRKAKISPAKIKKLNQSRLKLQKKAQGTAEVTLAQIKRAARVSADDTTVGRALRTLGIEWRSPREKPTRSAEQMAARREWATARQHHPKSYWQKKIHLYIDCKKFALPLSARPRQMLKRGKVRGVHRTRAEGIKPELTKPNIRKHRYPPGASAHVLAGVSNDRIVVWRYIIGRWNAATACKLYAGPILKALQKVAPERHSWTLVEDNDPAGFKARAAITLKQSLHINCLSLPPYSPDLMPLDYSLWHEIEKRAEKNVGERSFDKVTRGGALHGPTSLGARLFQALQATTHKSKQNKTATKLSGRSGPAKPPSHKSQIRTKQNRDDTKCKIRPGLVCIDLSLKPA